MSSLVPAPPQMSGRPREVVFSDTTLRDGAQMPGVLLEIADKIEIAQRLARIGVKSIDAGFPAAGSQEVAAVRAVSQKVRGAFILALCRTLRKDIDQANEALQGAPPLFRGVSLFVGTSPTHRSSKLRRTRAEILTLVAESIEYAREFFDSVSFSAEDGSRTELDFLVEVYRTAISHGARVIVFTDTVGILTPSDVHDQIRYLQDKIPNYDRAKLAVHFHNDLGLATANTLAAVEVGADIVQCAVNGIGERAGNASLEEVALALQVRQEKYQRRIAINLKGLRELSDLVATRTGVPVPPQKPVVGENIFRSAAGIHQDGLLKQAETYLPFPPQLLGVPGMTLALGPYSGRAAVRKYVEPWGIPISESQLDNLMLFLKDTPTGEWRDIEKLVRRALARTGL
jgi:2-isopropylmalate synthase